MGDQLLLYYVTQPATEELYDVVESLLDQEQASARTARTVTGSGVLYERIAHWDYDNPESCLQMLKLLLRYGADVNQTDRCARRSCLHLAVVEKNADVVRYLLTQPRVEVGFLNRSEQNVWHLAALVDEIDVDGHNAAYWAKQFGAWDCVAFLETELSSLPRSFTNAELVEQMAAAAAADKKPKAAKKGGKKKK
eukprot:g3146.t1